MSNVAEQNRECVQTIVIGGGQAGLAAGYHLVRRRLPFVILDAKERIGDAWRQRWNSLRPFTPAAYDSLPRQSQIRLHRFARHRHLPVRL